MVEHPISAEKLLLAQMRATRSLSSVAKLLLRPHHLTLVGWLVLLVVEKQGKKGVNAGDLAILVVMPLSQVTMLVKQHEAAQLVRAKPYNRDGRFKVVVITPRGRKVLEQIRERLATAKPEGYDARDVLAYLRIINKLLEDLAAV